MSIFIHTSLTGKEAFRRYVGLILGCGPVLSNNLKLGPNFPPQKFIIYTPNSKPAFFCRVLLILYFKSYFTLICIS